MGRKRDNPQSKRKEKSPEKVLNEIDASNLSDTELKKMVKRVLKELSEYYKVLYGSYKELTRTTSA